MVELTPVVLCLTQSALAPARRVAGIVGAEVHGLGARVDGSDETFDATMDHIAQLFLSGRPVIGICAAGILMRALGPLLSDKRDESPVIVMPQDLSAAVPLLGGHRGANDMAEAISDALSVPAIVTTAGDVVLGVALDVPPEGLRLANPSDVKAFTAAALAGGSVTTSGEGWWPGEAFARSGSPAAPGDAGATRVGSAKALRITATEAPVEGSPRHLVYHPRSFILGIGAARGCSTHDLCELVLASLAEANIAPGAIHAIATIDLKADEGAINALAGEFDVPVWLYPAARLETETPRLATPSEVVYAEVGCHGVAEGAALAAAGIGGALEQAKRKNATATCALARIGEAAEPGRLRGRVSLIGIGPGWQGWRTPEATRLVASANVLVGYGLYIDLLGSLARGKPRHDFPLGGEEARCRFALEEAGTGKDVALICSGDAGIYAMGALVHELLDRAPDEGGVSDPARRVEVITAPGITAMQAAAARIGAPLGHDFCAISLSDLLTPREQILNRLRAAAVGDFVVAFYNPVSKTRRTLLAEARDILLQHRPADTPVLLAASLGRPEETLHIRTLETLEVDEVDMLTTVIVGASQSRVVAHGDGPRIYTPRGYAKRIDETTQRTAS